MEEKRPAEKLHPTVRVVSAILYADVTGTGKPVVYIQKRREDGGFPGRWELPGGKCEPGELPHQTLKRELMEEIRFVPLAGDQMHFGELIDEGFVPPQLFSAEFKSFWREGNTVDGWRLKKTEYFVQQVLAVRLPLRHLNSLLPRDGEAQMGRTVAVHEACRLLMPHNAAALMAFETFYNAGDY